MKHFILAFTMIFLSAGIVNTSYASPFGILEIHYEDNKDGTYTYYVSVANLSQPIGTEFATPSGHMIYNWDSEIEVSAGGKPLSQDENIVVFGVDTGKDNNDDGFEILEPIPDNDTAFHGSAENGFNNSDNDEFPNRVIAWHLPFEGFSLEDTIQSEQTAGSFSFTLNQEITQFSYWIGGSDDTNIWNEDGDNYVMVEDDYGIYEIPIQAPDNGQYLATFLTRTVNAIKINNSNKLKHL